MSDQHAFPFMADASFVRNALIEARREALAGKFGPLSEEHRAECEAFLSEHDKPKGDSK